MVNFPCFFRYSSSCNSFYNFIITYIKCNNFFYFFIKFFKYPVKCFSLGNCSRKSVQNKSFFTIGFLKSCFHKSVYYIIRYEFPLIHKFFSFQSQWSFIGNSSSQYISCRNLRYFIFFSQFFRLSSFSCSRSSK